DGVSVTVDADHLRARRGENRTRVAAGPEGTVDVHAAGTKVEELDRGRTEHGDVTGRSASDTVPGAAARHHPRAPCGSSAALREPSCFLSARTFSVASASCARKRSGSQI